MCGRLLNEKMSRGAKSRRQVSSPDLVGVKARERKTDRSANKAYRRKGKGKEIAHGYI